MNSCSNQGTVMKCSRKKTQRGISRAVSGPFLRLTEERQAAHVTKVYGPKRPRMNLRLGYSSNSPRGPDEGGLSVRARSPQGRKLVSGQRKGRRHAVATGDTLLPGAKRLPKDVCDAPTPTRPSLGRTLPTATKTVTMQLLADRSIPHLMGDEQGLWLASSIHPFIHRSGESTLTAVPRPSTPLQRPRQSSPGGRTIEASPLAARDWNKDGS